MIATAAVLPSQNCCSYSEVTVRRPLHLCQLLFCHLRVAESLRRGQGRCCREVKEESRWSTRSLAIVREIAILEARRAKTKAETRAKARAATKANPEVGTAPGRSERDKSVEGGPLVGKSEKSERGKSVNSETRRLLVTLREDEFGIRQRGGAVRLQSPRRSLQCRVANSVAASSCAPTSLEPDTATASTRDVFAA